MLNIILGTIVLTINVLFVNSAIDKEDKLTRTEKRLKRQKDKARANVIKWKEAQKTTTIIVPRVAPTR